MTLTTLNKKGTKASNSIMSRLHSQKQKVVNKFRVNYLNKKNQNPDCFKIGNYIGLYLELADESDRATLQASTDIFIEDKSGNYYAVIGEIEEEKEPSSSADYSDSD